MAKCMHESVVGYECAFNEMKLITILELIN